MEGVSEQSKTPPRPPQVTVAAWMIMVGSIFVVLIVWDRIAALHSLDTRKALEPILDDQRMKDAGIELNDMLAVIRIVSMVAAGCATAMVVLGYQTLQRSRGARLALTVLAVPLFISGLATGGYVSSARRGRRRDPVAGQRPVVVRRQGRARGSADRGPDEPPGGPARLATAVRPRSAGTARTHATAVGRRPSRPPAPSTPTAAGPVDAAPDLEVRRTRGRPRTPPGRPHSSGPAS